MEKAILVGLQLPGTRRDEVKSSLAELARLAETAGARPEAEVIQHRAKIDPAYLIGRGKAAEIRDLVNEKQIATVLFDEDLKPVQQKNLEEIIEAKIIDRTRLILDIFARRARTREGILQVERAQLSYYLPRLTQRGIWLDSQTGGIGTRGPGERKLEVDQRRIRERITRLDGEIEQVRRQRQVTSKQREQSGQPVIAIVGYTNAGKSTLLNALSHGDTVYADNKLFATLDPTTRQVRLPGGRVALFSDTVGFINKLPHGLVAAFRATLEEITRADCLLHLIDVSHPDYEHQVQTVLGVLKELHADHIPMIAVYNKKDMLTPEQQRKLERQGFFLVSACTGEGIDDMLRRLENIVVPRLVSHELLLPYAQSDRIARLFAMAVVKQMSYTEKGIRLTLESTSDSWKKILALLPEHKKVGA
jgi:GTP-binding protein HflX